MKPTKSYQEALLNSLKDTVEAAAYLNAALEESDARVFQPALQNVAETNGIKVEQAELPLFLELRALMNALHLRFETSAK